MNGWIKIHRDIYDHWIWNDPIKLKWWIDLLLLVNHDDNKVNIGFELFECKRGETLMSLQNLSERWMVSRDTVRNFLVLLEKDGMISRKTHTKTTQITICNYDKYQSTLHDGQTQSKRKANSNRHKQEGIKKEEEIIHIPNWRDDFNVYLEECRTAFKSLAEDSEFVAKLRNYHPGYNIPKSIGKSFNGYWGTEKGWQKKKKEKTVNIDWRATIINGLQYSLVKE